MVYWLIFLERLIGVFLVVIPERHSCNLRFCQYDFETGQRALQY